MIDTVGGVGVGRPPDPSGVFMSAWISARSQCPAVDADVVDATIEVEAVPVGRRPMLTLAVEFCCVDVTVPTQAPSSS